MSTHSPVAEPKTQRTPPEDIQTAADEDARYRLEFWALSQKKPHYFDAVDNEEALRHTAEYLAIGFPLQLSEFRSKDGFAVFSRGKGIIYPK